MNFVKRWWFIILPIVLALAIGTFLIVKNVEPRIKEGYVVSLVAEPFDILYFETRRSVTRTVYYYNAATKSMAPTFVFDHYKYAVKKVTDYEDFVITIQRLSKKQEGVYLHRTIYIPENQFNNLDLGAWFQYEKDLGHSFRQGKNDVEIVTPWSRERPNLNEWLND